MTQVISSFILRNIKYIPYFFTKEFLPHDTDRNYALLGKLSASILHDILTPISSLSLASELTTDSQEQIKPIIKESTDQIKEYVDIMKDFLSSEKTQGNIHINVEVLKCMKLIKYKAHQHGVQIQFIEFDQIYTQINPLYIYQIVINLLSNAIEASINSPTKKVILILKKDSDNFNLECKDFGCGMSAQTKRDIFKPHFTTKDSNNGLGLFSVKQIVSSCLHGNISVQSEPDTGSLFCCTIPLLK